MNSSQLIPSPDISSPQNEYCISAKTVYVGQDVTDPGQNVILPGSALEGCEQCEMSQNEIPVENAPSGIQYSSQKDSGSPGSGDSLPIDPSSKAHTVNDPLSGQAQDCHPQAQWEGSGSTQAILEDPLTADNPEQSDISQNEIPGEIPPSATIRQPSDRGYSRQKQLCNNSGSPGSGDSLPIDSYSKAHSVYDSLSGQAQDCQPVEATQDCKPESQWEKTQDLLPGSRPEYQQQVSCADSGTETDPLDPYCSATFKQVGFADMQIDSRSSIEVPDTTAGHSHDNEVGGYRRSINSQDSGYGPLTPEANGDSYPGNSHHGYPQESESVPQYYLASVHEQPMMDTSPQGETHVDIDSDESDAIQVLSPPKSITGVLGDTSECSTEDALQLTDITVLPEPSLPDILPHSTV